MASKQVDCPVERALDVIAGRWRALIMRELLFRGTHRFGQLHRAVAGVSQRILIRELRALEEAGMVDRKVFDQVPPRVEYSATAKGRSLQPVLAAMAEWAAANT